MKKILSFLTVLLPLVALGQSNQNAAPGDTVIKSVTSKLNTYTANHSIEKAYLQFDKPYYAIKDTIYFKAYITLGPLHKLSALSGVLYADLIGPDNKISQSIKLPIIAGVAWGDFVLDESLKSGSYRVRAYTNWMRNEGDEAFFDQVTTIGSAESPGTPATQTAQSATSAKPDIQFLPEGGNLAAGNYSKIAFKAVGVDGLGKEIKGTVTDGDGAEVTTFASTHLGMGVFNIVPHAGATYKANITFADGTTNTVELPKAVNTGYTINVNNTNPDTLRIRITIGIETPQGPVNIIAQSGGVIYYAAQSGTFAKFFTAVIPKNKFPTGIVQFTVFSQAGEPLNERLVFIQNHDQLKLDVNTKPAGYTARQKMKIDLSAKDKSGKPVNGSFSVSVTDETKVPADELNENTILSNLLLTSALKGNIEQPNYYFTNAGEKTNADLDVLLLTQGYRHFAWKQILNDNSQTTAWQPEKGMEISGTVKRGGKPVAGAKLTLVSKSGGLSVIDTVADDNGRFVFKNLSFADSTKFVVQSKVAKGQDDVTLKLDSTISPQVIIKSIALQNSAEVTAYVTNQKQFIDQQEKAGVNQGTHMLKEVTIKDQKINPVPHSQNLNGAGNADQVISSKDLEKYNCGRLVDCISGRLTGVIFRNGAPLNSRREQSPMAIVIDGNFSDATEFDNLNPDDVEGVEVVLAGHYAVIYGTRMANGGLIVTTKGGRKSREYYKYAPGVVTFRPKGFYKAREFYSPQYDNSKTNKNIADLRTTIYWKPDIITDKNGKASFNYFNADGKGTYRMIIEGIDTDGNLGRQVVQYKVE